LKDDEVDRISEKIIAVLCDEEVDFATSLCALELVRMAMYSEMIEDTLKAKAKKK